ncbi:hypothetical protein, partial [Schaedlerella sp.]|uniref:hypothetical protein n=1 Tax=Schaedlerella sp. TaxID=2676057 RepID=UPI003744C68F
MDWNKATKIQNNYSDIYDYQRHNRGAFSASIGINKTSELANWSQGKELKELRASLETINKTAGVLIADIDRHFQEVCKERGIDLESGQEQ